LIFEYVLYSSNNLGNGCINASLLSTSTSVDGPVLVFFNTGKPNLSNKPVTEIYVYDFSKNSQKLIFTDVDEEYRLSLRQVWRYHSRLGITPWPIVQDGKAILFDSRDEDLRKKEKGRICQLDLDTGEELWSHAFDSKTLGKWQECADEEHLFCLPQYLGASDNHADPQPFCLDMRDGRLLWKFNSKKDHFEDAVEQLNGIFQNMLIASPGYGNNIVAFDADTGAIKWCVKSEQRYRNLFICLDKQLILGTGKKEISWISPEGKILKKRELPFPLKDTGQIDHVFEEKNNPEFYVSVWGAERDFEKPEEEREEVCIIYAVNKHTGKARVLAEFKNFRCHKFTVVGERLYLSGDRTSFVINPAQEKSNPVKLYWHVWGAGNELLFCFKGQRVSYNEMPEFKVLDAKGNVVWRREEFAPHAMSKDFLFGVEKRGKSDNGRNGHGALPQFLVVLDQKTGKELATLQMAGLRRIILLGDKDILVLLDEDVFRYTLEGR